LYYSFFVFPILDCIAAKRGGCCFCIIIYVQVFKMGMVIMVGGNLKKKTNDSKQNTGEN
jgi:hypothetical protein